MMTQKSSFFLLISFLILSCSSLNHDNTIMIPMRDGTKLSTLLIFPESNHKHYPVILIRTPYKKEMAVEKYRYFLENNYILAIQDVCGRFGSEGVFEPFVKEGKDGFDAIEWIASQAWCNGNIGMIGQSYDGWVQYCAAVEQPPHLKTIIPNCAPVDLFCDFPYRYGVLIPGALAWCDIIVSNATADVSGQKMQAISNKDWVRLLDHLPVSELDSIIFLRELDYYQRWIQHNLKDDYWKQSCCLEKIYKIKIPVFIQSGWFDTQLLNSKLAYNELIKAGNQNVKMIIGPWGQMDRESLYYEGKYKGEAADDINLQYQYLRWFDYWLKHKNNGILEEPLVQLYAMKSNRWYNDNTYPLQNTSDKKIYLSSYDKADLIANGGKLIFNDNELHEGFDTYTYNPDNVLTYPREMEGKADYLQKMLIKRDDYLFYKSSSFNAATTIIGRISAKLFASTSAPDTDWFAILVLLDNHDNFLEGISFGVLRAKFRNSFEKPELMERNKIYEFYLDMNHYGIRIETGQKLGLIITSSSGYPGMGKNLNTGMNNQKESDYEIAEQRIYHTKKYNSYISISVLKDDPLNN